MVSDLVWTEPGDPHFKNGTVALVSPRNPGHSFAMVVEYEVSRETEN